MTISRYRNVNSVDNKFFGTIDFPPKKELDKINVFYVRLGQIDRLDNLAARHLGSGEYWWVIAILNEMKWPYDYTAGDIIKIPVDVDEVLRLF